MSVTTPTTELSASCHILPMNEGLYCVSLGEPAMPAAMGAGLPGVRLSLPPGPQAEHAGVTISTFRPDGWLDLDRPAALVHVARGPARVMLTIYQDPAQPREAAPRLVITQLGQLLPGQPSAHPATMHAGTQLPAMQGGTQFPAMQAGTPPPAMQTSTPVPAMQAGTRVQAGPAASGFPQATAGAAFPPGTPAAAPGSVGLTRQASHATVVGQESPTPNPAAMPPETLVTAHVRNRGDIQARLTEWVGVPGSRLWIEGFGIALPLGWGQGELEYQGIVGKNGATPWLPAPEFCGSRGQTLPLLGLGLRLRGAAARLYDCTYRVSFIDGSTTGPVPHGQLCRAPSEAPLEAFQVTLSRKAM